MAKVSTTVLAALAVTSTTAARKAVAARIRATLTSNAAAVVKALEVLYARQTYDEQVIGETVHHNTVGFSGVDANLGTWLVTVVIAEGRAQGRPEDQLLRGKALEMGRRVASRYAATQLCDLALAKMDVEARRYVPPAPAALGCYTLAEESMSPVLVSRNDEWTAQDELASSLWPEEDNDWESERWAFAVNDD